MGDAHSSQCGLRAIKRRRPGKGGDAHPLFSMPAIATTIIIISYLTHYAMIFSIKRPWWPLGGPQSPGGPGSPGGTDGPVGSVADR